MRAPSGPQRPSSVVRLAGWSLVLVLSACPEPPGPPGQALPIIESFAAQPYSVRPGDASTISWSVKDADSVTLQTGAEQRQVALQGSERLVIGGPLEVRLVAQNAFGQTESQLSILTPSDQKVSIDSFEVSPRSVQPNEPVRVSWRTTGASGVSLVRATGVAVMDPAPTQGTFSFRFRSSATLRLVARGLDGPAIAEVPLEVADPAPLIRLFEPTAPQFRDGDDIVLRALAAGALRFELRLEGALIQEGAFPADGLLTLPSTGPGIFNLELRALSLSGDDTAETQIRVVPVSDIVFETFEVTPSVVGPGGTVDITWLIRGAETVNLSPGFGPVASSGRTTAKIQQSTTFALQANRSGESKREERQVVVDFTRPGLTTRLDPMVVAQGETSTLSWQALTATSVAVFDVSGRSLLIDAPIEGSLAVTPEAPTSYLVRASNTSGITEAAVFLDVDVPPSIDSFSVPSPVRTGIAAAIDVVVTNHEQATLQAPSSFRSWNAGQSAPQILTVSSSPGTHVVTLEARSRRLTRTATQTVVALPRVFDDQEPNDELFQAIGPSASYPHVFDGLADDTDLVFFNLPLNRRLDVSLDLQACTSDTLELSIVPIEITRPSMPQQISVQGECPRLTQNTPGLSDWSMGAVRIRALGIHVPYRITLNTLIYRCGDTTVDRTEQCDDGNRSNGDGCDSSCRREDTDESEPNDDRGRATTLALGVFSTAWLKPRDNDVWLVNLRNEESGNWRLSTQGINGADCPDMKLSLNRGFTTPPIERSSTVAEPCPEFEAALPPGSSFISVSAADLNPDIRRSPVRGGYQISVVPISP